MRQFFPLFYENFLIYSDTKIPFGGVWRGFLREIKDYSQMSKKQCSRSSPEQARKEGYYPLHFSLFFSSHSRAGRRKWKKERTNHWDESILGGLLSPTPLLPPICEKREGRILLVWTKFSSSFLNSRTRRTHTWEKSKSILIEGKTGEENFSCSFPE